MRGIGVADSSEDEEEGAPDLDAADWVDVCLGSTAEALYSLLLLIGYACRQARHTSQPSWSKYIF